MYYVHCTQLDVVTQKVDNVHVSFGQLHEHPGLPLDVLVTWCPGAGLHSDVHSEHRVHDGASVHLRRIRLEKNKLSVKWD